jgi:hypothetical protein
MEIEFPLYNNIKEKKSIKKRRNKGKGSFGVAQ